MAGAPASPEVAASLAADPAARRLRSGGAAVTGGGLHLADVQRALAAALLADATATAVFGTVRAALERDGYVVVAVPGFAALPSRGQDMLAVAASAVLGTPSPVRATTDIVIWDVRPRPGLPAAQRRGNFSLSAGEACLHTDSTFSAHPERWFGLWCLRPASDGGASVLVDGHEVWRSLGRSQAGTRARQTLAAHDVPLWDGQRTVGVRVFRPAADGTVAVRYRADLVERGVRESLSPSDPIVAALRVLGRALAAPTRRTSVRLEADHVLFVDNHRVLHAREHFTDPGRHLLRIRMSAPALGTGATLRPRQAFDEADACGAAGMTGG